MASTSASSYTGTMSNMSRLLSSSRLASYHPKVHQVYTAPASHISRGDFGVKRPLPTSHLSPGQIRYVDIEKIDTKEGQTAWREKESEVVLLKRLRELNVKFDTEHPRQELLYEQSQTKKGILGPRINSRYDTSTIRAVPTDFRFIKKKADRLYLESEAKLGKAPIYARSIYNYENDDDSFGRASDQYTRTPSARLNFRTMSKNRFEKYLEEIRKRRESFKDHLALKEAALARATVAAQYEAHREALAKEAKQAQAEAAEAEVISMDLPKRVQEGDLPILKRGYEDEKSVKIDLWQEARNSNYLQRQWDPWLQTQDLAIVRESESGLLPLRSMEKGGFEIPMEMHAHGGLQYGQPDDIATQSLHDPLPARVLGKSVNPDKRSAKYERQTDLAVALGGNIAVMPSMMSNQATSIDTSGNDTQRGNINVRVTQASREAKADVNDQYGGKRVNYQNNDDRLPSQYGSIRLSVRSSDSTDQRVKIRGIPGSADWISLEPGRGRDSNVVDLTDMDNLANGTSSIETSRSYVNLNKEYPGRSRSEALRRLKSNQKRSAAGSSQNYVDIFTSIIKPYQQANAADKAKSAKNPEENS